MQVSDQGGRAHGGGWQLSLTGTEGATESWDRRGQQRLMVASVCHTWAFGDHLAGDEGSPGRESGNDKRV